MQSVLFPVFFIVFIRLMHSAVSAIFYSDKSVSFRFSVNFPSVWSMGLLFFHDVLFFRTNIQWG